MHSKFNKLLSNGSVFVVCSMLANFINFVFNAYLGRTLSFEEYAVVTLVNTSYFFVFLFIQGLANTINHKVAYLTGEKGKTAGYRFFRKVLKPSLIWGLIGTILLFVLIPVLKNFFHIQDNLVFVSFAPLFFAGVFSAAIRGYFQGVMLFGLLAIAVVAESLVKFLSGVLLYQTGFKEYTYLSIPLSLMFTAFLMFVFINLNKPKETSVVTNDKFKFPFSFYLASIFNGLAITTFLSLDVILAKHFLNSYNAGAYSVLSLVGKMVYFFGSLFNGFIITFTSREMGQHKNIGRAFSIIFAICLFLTTAGFVLLGVFGHVTVPILLGEKSKAIIPYLMSYSFGIALFTLTSSIVQFHVTKHNYLFSVLAILNSLLVFIGLQIWNDSIADFSRVMFYSGTVAFAIIGLTHLFWGQGKFIKRIFVDLFDLLSFNAPLNETDPQNKRILVFNWRDTRHKFAGGAEVYIHELAKRWVKTGHSVTVFCGNDGLSPRYEEIDGVKIVRRGGFYFVYVWAFFYYIFKFRGKYDVIIDCENGIPFFTPLYTFEKQFLLIHHVHQDIFRTSLVSPFSNLAEFLESKLMPLIYQKSKVITVSPSSRNEIIDHELTENEIEIIYNGVDIEHFSPGQKSTNPTILYLGRLKKYKSVDVLLKAAKQIFNNIPDAELLIAGDGEEYPKLVQLAKHLGIYSKVKFLGRVSEELKAELYRKAWVFVNPSYLEGWGITTIEANACGTPVVASRVSGLIDSVKNPHTGFLVDYGDVDGFSEKISLLISDRKLRTKMSSQAIDWASEFTWNKSAARALEVLFPNEKS